MQASDVLTDWRDITGESSQNRFPDSLLLRSLSFAQQDVITELGWPDGMLTFPTVVTTPPTIEYQLPELIAIKESRVYVAGQRTPRTTIAQLEGDGIYLYDQTAPGFIPQWKFAPATTYPVSSDIGLPHESATPYFPGRRPQYYLRGGNIGIVPPPAGIYNVQVDCIMSPPVTKTDQLLIVPSNFRNALVQHMLRRVMAGDKDTDWHDRAAFDYTEALKALRKWKAGYTADDKQDAIIFVPRRAFSPVPSIDSDSS